MMHEPTLAHIPLSSITDELKGDTFHMAVTEDGMAVYHVYGGYTIICDGRLSSLNSIIRDYIYKSKNDSFTNEEEREGVELAMSATRYVLSAPMFAFSDAALTYDIAKVIVDYLVSIQDDADNALLGPDDAEENADMIDSIELAETITTKPEL